MTTEVVHNMVDEFEAHFISRNDWANRWGNIVSSYLWLPGLVAFWPFSTTKRDSGLCYDVSGAGRNLTVNGSVSYTSGTVPYVHFSGSAGVYLSRADEADLDLSGVESYMATANKGVTFGGWFKPNAAGVSARVYGKSDDSNGPYYLHQEAAKWLFRIRNATDTTNYDVRSTSDALAEWQFVACRFYSNNEIKIYHGHSIMETNTNTTSIPTSIFNGTDTFAIGGDGAGSSNYNGDAALCFLSAQRIHDTTLFALYQQSKFIFRGIT